MIEQARVRSEEVARTVLCDMAPLTPCSGVFRAIGPDSVNTDRAVISVMLAVPDAPNAVAWYKRALGAIEL
jgi:hypothetical protein